MKNLLLAAALAASPAAAQSGGQAHIADLARKALDKGYGSTCSLEMKPVDRGGYFPCLDFGPYRLVFVYGAVKGFVVQEGREPFPILAGTPDSPEFTREGPWTTDMPARLAMWWNDVVEGGAERQADRQRRSAEEMAAQDYVKKLMGSGSEKEASREEILPSPPVEAAGPASPSATSPIGDDIKQILAH